MPEGEGYQPKQDGQNNKRGETGTDTRPVVSEDWKNTHGVVDTPQDRKEREERRKRGF